MNWHLASRVFIWLCLWEAHLWKGWVGSRIWHREKCSCSEANYRLCLTNKERSGASLAFGITPRSIFLNGLVTYLETGQEKA
jgi:hypothetical protein